MAAGSFFALFDDIATLLDDIAAMSKVAAKKTAGVLGDDLALNAQQVAGVTADRELPIVWAVAMGSLINKSILVPSALAISTLMPWAVIPLLMLGGLYLCFEGVEKLAHNLLHSEKEEHQHHVELVQAVASPEVDMVAYEKEKIRGAIRTDFILSAEIIVITLGTVAGEPFAKQLAVLVAIAIIMTAGVYGFVAAIVKLDDAGLYLTQLPGRGLARTVVRRLGSIILQAAPLLMKGLSVAGTVAMFLVGGGILIHGIPGAGDILHGWSGVVSVHPMADSLLQSIVSMSLNAIAGVVAGCGALGCQMLVKRLGRLIGRPALSR